MRPLPGSAAGEAARAVLAGVLGGILAAHAMDRFQRQAGKLMPSSGGGDPATVRAAERALGHPLPKARKPAAGTAVHLGFGAALGAVYGLAAELEPRVAAGFGLPFGGAVAVLADEALVPAAGLSSAPWRTPPASHAYSLASHLVFGAALEAARRLLRRVL